MLVDSSELLKEMGTMMESSVRVKIYCHLVVEEIQNGLCFVE
jgi:hypothetical protein